MRRSTVRGHCPIRNGLTFLLRAQDRRATTWRAVVGGAVSSSPTVYGTVNGRTTCHGGASGAQFTVMSGINVGPTCTLCATYGGASLPTASQIISEEVGVNNRPRFRAAPISGSQANIRVAIGTNQRRDLTTSITSMQKTSRFIATFDSVSLSGHIQYNSQSQSATLPSVGMGAFMGVYAIAGNNLLLRELRRYNRVVSDNERTVIASYQRLNIGV